MSPTRYMRSPTSSAYDSQLQMTKSTTTPRAAQFPVEALDRPSGDSDIVTGR